MGYDSYSAGPGPRDRLCGRPRASMERRRLFEFLGLPFDILKAAIFGSEHRPLVFLDVAVNQLSVAGQALVRTIAGMIAARADRP